MSDQKNPLIKSFPITLDRERNLFYSQRSTWLIEQKTGLKYMQGEFKQLWDEPTPERLAVLVWAGLVHEDKELTPEAVAEMLPLNGSAELFQLVLEAFAGSGERKASGSAPPADPHQAVAQV
jgi:hypothetical protein